MPPINILTIAAMKSSMKLWLENTGQTGKLGIKVRKVKRGEVTLMIPYSESLVGNPFTGVMHGGVLTTLMDTCCGMAALSAMKKPAIAPTLDLRIDYMTAAEPGEPVFAVAEAYYQTPNVIFARGHAYQDCPDSPIAQCAATFMRLEHSSADVAKMFKDGLARLSWGGRCD